MQENYGYRLQHSKRFMQANGQAKRSNRTIVDGIKKRTKNPGSLGTTTLRRSYGHTTSLGRSPQGKCQLRGIRGRSNVPTKLKTPTLIVANFDAITNAKLDFMEECRLDACQRRVGKHFNKKVRPKTFQVGEYVMRQTFLKPQGISKKDLKWEGSYVVIDVLTRGSQAWKTGWNTQRTPMEFYSPQKILLLGTLITSVRSLLEHFNKHIHLWTIVLPHSMLW